MAISKATAAITKVRWYAAGQMEKRDMNRKDKNQFAWELWRYASELYDQTVDPDDDDDDDDSDLDDDE